MRLQEDVPVAFVVRLVPGAQVIVSPVLGLEVDVIATVPAKLFRLANETEMLAPEAPMLKSTGEAAVMVKLPTWTTELAMWDAVPGEPEPVIVTR